MGNRLQDQRKELKQLESGGKYKVHWFRRVLVWVFIIVFWLLYYWSRT